MTKLHAWKGAAHELTKRYPLTNKVSVEVMRPGLIPEPPPPLPPKPGVKVSEDAIEIRETIQFAYKKTAIEGVSLDRLNEIADVISKNPRIRKIRIEGHASSEGTPEQQRKLSEDRAKAVMKYLVARGVPEERLIAEGFGVRRPIADDETEEGKRKNRRVEFDIIE